MNSRPSRQLKTSSPSRRASEADRARRERLEDLSTFHLALTASLFPDATPALMHLSISDLERELIVRTMRMKAERERLEKEIATRRARLHDDLLPFLDKPHV